MRIDLNGSICIITLLYHCIWCLLINRWMLPLFNAECPTIFISIHLCVALFYENASCSMSFAHTYKNNKAQEPYENDIFSKMNFITKNTWTHLWLSLIFWYPRRWRALIMRECLICIFVSDLVGTVVALAWMQQTDNFMWIWFIVNIMDMFEFFS